MKTFISILVVLFLLIGCIQKPAEEQLPEQILEKSETKEPVIPEETKEKIESEENSEVNKNQDSVKEYETKDYEVSQSNNYVQSPIFTFLNGCEEKDKVEFASIPIDIKDINLVEPQGELTNSGHVTPGDHIGIQYDPKTKVDVRAMADGYIVRVERQPRWSFVDAENYHVYFEYSCKMFGSFVHVTEIDPEILEANAEFKQLASGKAPKDTKSIYIRLPVKTGQLIGKAETFGLLGMLTVDTDVVLKGFSVPDHYSEEPWKTHAVPPFDYFTEPLKTQLLEKNPRKKEPLGGKIDFDVNGTLSGTWFLEGSGYYRGNEEAGYCDGYLCPYWNGHLSFVRDFVDPDEIRISIGYKTGIDYLTPYGVKNNGPAPESIGVEDGLVKYNLVELEGKDSEYGIESYGKQMITKHTDNVVGVMLVQMLDNQTIKVEIFPDKDSSKANSFTGSAKTYAR
ncbi:hypothetical protein HYT84_02390 [Candidatus Micrarchaeota archaeon]|nr:hypothetical protein [Candidatus Micrarchaeota archaeon]